MRLLLIEDNQKLGAGLEKGLQRAGYSMEWVDTGEDGLAAAASGNFDVAILDLNLPDISGIEVMQRLRGAAKTRTLPVIMLTALDAVEHKIKGLDSGANDYLTKPFDFGELLARLRALTRKHQGEAENILISGDIELNCQAKLVKKAGRQLLLTAREIKLLTMLMQRRGHIVNKSEIEEELYGWDEGADSNTVEVVIYNLRKKLGKNAILTMRGVGYMMPV